jgi:aromatic ring-cleaving dioxygenase
MHNESTPVAADRVRDPGIIRDYHAHIYYDPGSSRDRAERLRERVAAAFPVARLGRWHDAPVGRIHNRCTRSRFRARRWPRSCRG